MNLRSKLSERIHIEDIREMLHYIHDNEALREEIYQLIFDEDERISYQALWVCTHFAGKESEWLCSKQTELIDEVLVCPLSGKRRMLLSLLYEQPMKDSPRMDIFDFCMERMISRQEPPGIQALCIKLAYELTRSIAELQQELCYTLEMMEPELLAPAVRATRRNILKAINAKKKERYKR